MICAKKIKIKNHSNLSLPHYNRQLIFGYRKWMTGLCISIREQVGSSFKTCDLSVTVQNSITDMVKDVANEPSVGLYFVQQHVHKAVPGLLSQGY